MSQKFEVKEGQGSMFRNKNKKQPNHPDYQGSIKLDGKEWKLAAWEKSGKSASGIEWQLLSLAVDKLDAGNSRPTRKEVGFDDLDNDVPF